MAFLFYCIFCTVAADTSCTVKLLPVKQRGRPLLLGEKLDSQVKSYIQAVREGDSVVTTSHWRQLQLLSENQTEAGKKFKAIFVVG